MKATYMFPVQMLFQILLTSEGSRTALHSAGEFEWFQRRGLIGNLTRPWGIKRKLTIERKNLTDPLSAEGRYL